MSAIFKLDARSYSFTDGDEIITSFNETGIHAYEINKIPTASPYNANARGPNFQSDAPKRFEFVVVPPNGSTNPYSGLILPSTVNVDLSNLGGSAFSIVTAFRLRDFHVGGNSVLLAVQGVSADLGSWLLTAQEVTASTFRVRFATTSTDGLTALIAVMDEVLNPDTWWVVSFNFDGVDSFWHLDTVEEPDIGSGITDPGTRTSVAGTVGISSASTLGKTDGDLGYVAVFKPNLSDSALRLVECDLMDYFKGEPCAAQAGLKEYCNGIDAEIN